MRPAALVLALVVLPGALAAGYTLGVDRHMEAPIGADGSASFAMPLAIDEDGALYAKLIPVSDNAALHEPGWIVHYALVRANGTTDMGNASGSTPTMLVPAAQGETGTFTIRLTPAPSHAADPVVYVALAFRAAGGGNDAGSGASLDEARALTLTIAAASASTPPSTSTSTPPTTSTPPSTSTSTPPSTTTPTPPTTPTADSPVLPPVSPIVVPKDRVQESTSAGGLALSSGLVTALVVAIGILTLAVIGLMLAVLLVWIELRNGRAPPRVILAPAPRSPAENAVTVPVVERPTEAPPHRVATFERVERR